MRCDHDLLGACQQRAGTGDLRGCKQACWLAPGRDWSSRC